MVDEVDQLRVVRFATRRVPSSIMAKGCLSEVIVREISSQDAILPCFGMDVATWSLSE